MYIYIYLLIYISYKLDQYNKCIYIYTYLPAYVFTCIFISPAHIARTPALYSTVVTRQVQGRTAGTARPPHLSVTPIIRQLVFGHEHDSYSVKSS